MNLFLGALAEGFLLAPLALGLYLSWRVYDILDLTVDGSFGVGGATTIALLVRGIHPVGATMVGGVAGMGAGVMTGLLCTRLRVNASLAGVLVSTAIYSVILAILGGGTLTLGASDSLMSLAAGIAERRLGLSSSLTLFGATVSGESVATLVLMGLLAAALTFALILFLQTDLGLAIRASGGNPQMARSVGVNVDHMLILGLGLSNGLVGLSGALQAQVLGYANIQMGVGAVVAGLATLLIGEALFGRRSLARSVGAALAGALLYRTLIAVAVRVGINANALRLLTALLVLGVLLLPRLTRLPHRRPAAQNTGHA